jgi:adenosylmethionine-8-amino-7-oxononanoate aminotransferase
LRYPELCAAGYYGVKPDLICLGKSLGNGMPISAVIGRRELMQRIAPGNKPNCFWSATMFGETLSIAAALATIDEMTSGGEERLRENAGNAYAIAKTAISGCPLIEISTPPLSRLSFCDPGIARQFRREMARNGALLYSAHNVMTCMDKHDWAILRRAYERTMMTITSAPEHSTDDQSHGIMRR